MKLVRDNIPGMHARGELKPHSSGVDRSRQVFRTAAPDEYRLLLLAKLAEEVGEVISAMTREQRLEELGDVLTVVDALLNELEATDSELAKVSAKTRRFGGYDERWVLEWTTEKENEK